MPLLRGESGLINSGSSFFGDIWNGIKDAVGTVYHGIDDNIVSPIVNTVSGVVNGLHSDAQDIA